MNKAAKLVLALLVLSAAASATALLLRGGPSGRTARITLDGELISEIDLDLVQTPYTFTVTGSGGLTNTIRVEHGRIRVEAAACPDQICVRQGYISNSAAPIVCLPNRLIIEITGGGSALDAAAG